MKTTTPFLDAQGACAPGLHAARVRSVLLGGSSAAYGGAIAPVVRSEQGTGLSFVPSSDDLTGLPPRGAPV